MAAYEDMPNPIHLSITLLAATLLTPPSIPVTADPIAPLDECIQHRFLGATTFGMSRILPNRYHGVLQFRTENAAEQRVVADLAREGYQVAVFLAGRHVLDEPPAFASPRYGLQGPAFIANVTSAASLPDRDTLLAEARRAVQSFVGNEAQESRLDAKLGDWVIAMRPLRASSEACVLCHTVGIGTFIRDDNHKPKLGDTLGVAMYVYHR
jgi:hypothetical protein